MAALSLLRSLLKKDILTQTQGISQVNATQVSAVALRQMFTTPPPPFHSSYPGYRTGWEVSQPLLQKIPRRAQLVQDSKFQLAPPDVPRPHRLDTKLLFCILLSAMLCGTQQKQKLSQVHRGHRAWTHTVPKLGSSTRAQSPCAKQGQQSRAVMATGITRGQQGKPRSQVSKKGPARHLTGHRHTYSTAQTRAWCLSWQTPPDPFHLIRILWTHWFPHLCILQISWHTHTQNILIWDS